MDRPEEGKEMREERVRGGKGRGEERAIRARERRERDKRDERLSVRECSRERGKLEEEERE